MMTRLIETYQEFYTSLTESDSYNDYPAAARKLAQKALDWKQKYGDQVKAGTAVGWKRAHQLAKGEKLTLDTIKRMKAFFDRHQGNKQIDPKYKDEPWKDNGYVAWLLWGGDPAREWAENKIKELEEQAKKQLDEAFVSARNSDIVKKINANTRFKIEVIRSLERIKQLISNNEWLEAKQDLELLVQTLEQVF